MSLLCTYCLENKSEDEDCYCSDCRQKLSDEDFWEAKNRIYEENVDDY